mgnify:FL=1|jgi:phage virion morphogenesis family|nr:MAG TPA: tail morphogenesis protein [Caudoviricetes sp.]
MQSAKLVKVIARLTAEYEKEINVVLPRKVAVMAKQHFRNNFRQSGFVDGGLRPWQRAQREGGSSTSAQYRTLTSARNHLMSSIEAVPSRASVLVYNPVPYARIHNEGGMLISNPTVTPKMRKWFWAQYYHAGGDKGGEAAEKWKRIALGARDKLMIKVRMPKRQFIGESKELRERINEEIIKSINKVSDNALKE